MIKVERCSVLFFELAVVELMNFRQNSCGDFHF